MTQEELTEQLAAAFKASARNRRAPLRRHYPTASPPLKVPPLPPEIVDEMEAAINEAFEQVDPEQAETDESFDC